MPAYYKLSGQPNSGDYTNVTEAKNAAFAYMDPGDTVRVYVRSSNGSVTEASGSPYTKPAPAAAAPQEPAPPVGAVSTAESRRREILDKYSRKSSVSWDTSGLSEADWDKIVAVYASQYASSPTRYNNRMSREEALQIASDRGISWGAAPSSPPAPSQQEIPPSGFANTPGQLYTDANGVRYMYDSAGVRRSLAGVDDAAIAHVQGGGTWSQVDAWVAAVAGQQAQHEAGVLGSNGQFAINLEHRQKYGISDEEFNLLKGQSDGVIRAVINDIGRNEPNNADVAALITNYSSAASAGEESGISQPAAQTPVYAPIQSLPTPDGWSESMYLKMYPDVAAAIERGEIGSALEHYNNWGKAEGRQGNFIPTGWNETTYLETYPDVAAAVQSGDVASGLSHYLQWGGSEGRQGDFTPAGWNEQQYLTNYPDVAAAVQNGDIPSGLFHYLEWGKDEGRNFSVPTSPPVVAEPAPAVPGGDNTSDAAPPAPEPISTSSDVVALYEALQGFDLTIDRSTGRLVDIKNKDGSDLTPQQYEDLNDRIMALEGLELSPEEGAELVAKLDEVEGVDITYTDGGGGAAQPQQEGSSSAANIEHLYNQMKTMGLTVSTDGTVMNSDGSSVGDIKELAQGLGVNLTDEDVAQLASMFSGGAVPAEDGEGASTEDTTADEPGDVVNPDNSNGGNGAQPNVESPANENSNAYQRETSASGFTYPWSAAKSVAGNDAAAVQETIEKAVNFMNAAEGKSYAYDRTKGTITSADGKFITRDDVQSLNNIIVKNYDTGYDTSGLSPVVAAGNDLADDQVSTSAKTATATVDTDALDSMVKDHSAARIEDGNDKLKTMDNLGSAAAADPTGLGALGGR